MSLPVVLGLRASADLEKAFAWYASENPAAARAFMAGVARTLGHIEWFPTGYQIWDGDVRRAIVSRFQFGVFYRILATEVYVVAVLSNRDDPDHFQQRITES